MSEKEVLSLEAADKEADRMEWDPGQSGTVFSGP